MTEFVTILNKFFRVVVFLFLLGFVDSAMSNILNGQHLQIATLDVRPYMSIDRDDKGNIYHSEGLVSQIIHWLSIRFNFTFTLVVPLDGTFGALINNTWNGMIGMALDRQVQLIAAPIVPSFERVRVLDFTTPFYHESICCLIPAPEAHEGGLTTIAKPFNYQVWIWILLSMLCIALATWLTAKLDPIRQSVTKGSTCPRQNQHKPRTLAEHLFLIFGIICLQPKDSTTSSPNCSPIVGAVWCLSCVVLIYLYTGVLISYITIPKVRPIVDSTEELANSDRLQVATIKNSIFETTLLQSTSGPLKILGDHLRQNPQNSLSGEFYNLNKLLEKAVLGRYAIVMGKSQAESVIELDWKRENQCRLSIMREQVLPTRTYCFALPKGLPFTQLINKGFIDMYDTGLINYWKNRSPLAVARCDATYKGIFVSNKKKKPLSPKNLSGAFYLLIIGISASLTTFLIEILVAKCHLVTTRVSI